MNQKDIGNKITIYKLKTVDEVMKCYDEWGDKDKYNKDIVDWSYTGPKETIATYNKYRNNKDTKKWEEVEFFKSDYIASKDVNAWLGLYKVL
tara:strand:+ start:210 stop:485 length:276 start_codon:yes stop_codon:yes gene_type:complete